MEFKGICLTFNCETNGFQGGDAGHGGQTIITIKNHYGEASFSVDDCEIGSGESTKMVFRGDWELSDLIEGLEKIINYLKENK